MFHWPFKRLSFIIRIDEEFASWLIFSTVLMYYHILAYTIQTYSVAYCSDMKPWNSLNCLKITCFIIIFGIFATFLLNLRKNINFDFFVKLYYEKHHVSGWLKRKTCLLVSFCSWNIYFSECSMVLTIKMRIPMIECELVRGKDCTT